MSERDAGGKMRITHVVESLDRGGLERVVVDLVAAQVATDHACQVLCLFHVGTLGGELRELGVEVVDCGKQPGLDRAALGRARRAIRAHRTRILHTHNPVAHYYAVPASLGLGVSVVVNTRHGMGAAARNASREIFYRLMRPFTDHMVAVCEHGRREFLAKGTFTADKARVVRNGIRVEAIRGAAAADARAEARARLGLVAEDLVLGSVGRLNWAKDQATLLEAYARVAGDHPESRLVIVGDGPLRAEIEARIDSLGIGRRVLLAGDRSDVPEILPAFDVFVLSSVTEGYSVALLEAAAAGLPLIATRVGGNPEIVNHGSHGRIVPPKDAAALAAAMRELAASEDERAECGAASLRWVREHGTIAAMAEAYDRLYAGLREQRARSCESSY